VAVAFLEGAEVDPVPAVLLSEGAEVDPVPAVLFLEGATVDPVPGVLEAMLDPEPQPDALATRNTAVAHIAAYPATV
jgi:hypothetical protein